MNELILEMLAALARGDTGTAEQAFERLADEIDAGAPMGPLRVAAARAGFKLVSVPGSSREGRRQAPG